MEKTQGRGIPCTELQGAEGYNGFRRRQESNHPNFLGTRQRGHRLRLDIRKSLLCRRVGQPQMGVQRVGDHHPWRSSSFGEPKPQPSPLGVGGSYVLSEPQRSLRANTSHPGTKISAVSDLNHNGGVEGSHCSLHRPRFGQTAQLTRGLGGNLSARLCGAADPRGWWAPAPEANSLFLQP